MVSLWAMSTLLLVTMVVTLASKIEPPQVTTLHGTVEGEWVTGRNNKDYASFQGIPYATMPKRFMAPEEPPNWTDVLQAKTPGRICPQFEVMSEEFVDHDENCLFLNIYVAPITNTTNEMALPVMVYIHGGSYQYGAGSFQGPDYFMANGQVILVTFNYRLGSLGFLSLGEENENLTQNNGLRDMIAALKWIQLNIKAFNGDPQGVTIFGESAGAGSVGALILSPQAKGLFSKGISESGTIFCPWGINKNPQEMTKRLAQSLNCEGTDPWDADKILQCLKSQSVRALLEAESAISKTVVITFAPTIDGTAKNPILPDTPYNLLTSSKWNHSSHVPYIIGYNEKEGLINALEDLTRVDQVDALNQNWTGVLPNKLGLPYVVDGANATIETAENIRQFYFKGALLSNETIDNYTNIYSDFLINWPSRHTAILHAQHGTPVYVYRFTFPGNFSVAQSYGIPVEGVTHEDELQYLFNSKSVPQYWPELAVNSKEETFSQNFIETWITFAKSGVPSSWNDPWTRVPETVVNSLTWFNIKENPEIEGESVEFIERLKFWDNIFPPL